MRTHLHWRHRETGDYERLATWCGRDIGRGRVVTRLTQVSCALCREAFAARLRQLPDVFPERKDECANCGSINLGSFVCSDCGTSTLQTAAEARK